MTTIAATHPVVPSRPTHPPAADLRIDVRVNGRLARAATAAVPADAAVPIDGLMADPAAGRIVTLIPDHAQLTLDHAAELLNVSPPYVTQRIADGRLPASQPGDFPRIRYGDLMVYKRRADAEAHAALDEMTREAHELGLDD